MAPEMPAAQTSPESDRLSSEAVLGILSSFPRKPMNTKVGYNFMTQFRHRICIILSPDVRDMTLGRNGCESGNSGRGLFYGNQFCFSLKEDLVQGKVEHSPRLPKNPRWGDHSDPIILLTRFTRKLPPPQDEVVACLLGVMRGRTPLWSESTGFLSLPIGTRLS
jgi:hypothetical protein